MMIIIIINLYEMKYVHCEVQIQKIFIDAKWLQHFNCNLLQFFSISISMINIGVTTFLSSKFQQNCISQFTHAI